jgi:peptidoglycan/xylan/chitin deacetylase (PgdA/CDA1 family)
MTGALWALGLPALWAGYAWGSHLLTLGSVWRGRPTVRAAALTFDDGPDPEHTPRLLDILGAEGVKGTFFLIGKRAAAAPALARRVAEEGHDLGNHTWSHRSLWLCGPRETARQVSRGHAAIADAGGQPPRFFRPPWGMTNLALFPVLHRLDIPCVFWSLQPEGLRAVAPGAQVAWALQRVRPGAILDLHDAGGVPGAGARLVDALPALIAGLRARGYALVPLRDLL